MPLLYHTAVFNEFTLQLAFLCLMIASAVATGIINKVCKVVNEHGNDIGVEASKGTTFIGMTWAATVLVILAGVVWVVEFIKGRRERVSYMIEGKEGQY